MVTMDMYGAVKNLSCLRHMFPADREPGNVLISCFNSHIVNECAFHSLFNAMFFAFL